MTIECNEYIQSMLYFITKRYTIWFCPYDKKRFQIIISDYYFFEKWSINSAIWRAQPLFFGKTLVSYDHKDY